MGGGSMEMGWHCRPPLFCPVVLRRWAAWNPIEVVGGLPCINRGSELQPASLMGKPQLCFNLTRLLIPSRDHVLAVLCVCWEREWLLWSCMFLASAVRETFFTLMFLLWSLCTVVMTEDKQSLFMASLWGNAGISRFAVFTLSLCYEGIGCMYLCIYIGVCQKSAWHGVIKEAYHSLLGVSQYNWCRLPFGGEETQNNRTTRLCVCCNKLTLLLFWNLRGTKIKKFKYKTTCSIVVLTENRLEVLLTTWTYIVDLVVYVCPRETEKWTWVLGEAVC